MSPLDQHGLLLGTHSQWRYGRCICAACSARIAYLRVTLAFAIFLLFFLGQTAKGEHDQAMSAYSTAARLLPGSHLPLLYIGMAQAQMNNLPLAARYLERAMGLCGACKPLCIHEGL